MSKVFIFFFFVCIAASAVTWLFMALHNFKMLSYARKGMLWMSMIDPFMWRPKRAERYFTHEGMAHYHKTFNAAFVFMCLLMAALAFMVLAALAGRYGY